MSHCWANSSKTLSLGFCVSVISLFSCYISNISISVSFIKYFSLSPFNFLCKVSVLGSFLFYPYTSSLGDLICEPKFSYTVREMTHIALLQICLLMCKLKFLPLSLKSLERPCQLKLSMAKIAWLVFAIKLFPDTSFNDLSKKILQSHLPHESPT